MYGSHPANLALRFALEVTSLMAIGLAAGRSVGGPTGWAVGMAAAGTAALAWGLFNVPGDPSRSGSAPIRVPGPVRLALELTIFTTAFLSFPMVFSPGWLAYAFGALLVLHHALSLDRIRWLLAR